MELRILCTWVSDFRPHDFLIQCKWLVNGSNAQHEELDFKVLWGRQVLFLISRNSMSIIDVTTEFLLDYCMTSIIVVTFMGSVPKSILTWIF